MDLYSEGYWWVDGGMEGYVWEHAKDPEEQINAE